MLSFMFLWCGLSTADVLVTNTLDTGPGSLRGAIAYASTNPGPDAVIFNIPTTDPGFDGIRFTIAPLSALPKVTDAGTTIDGATQTAFTGDTNADGPEVTISGTNLAAVYTGPVRFLADNGTVANLAMVGFQAGWGVRCDGAAGILCRGNRIESCTYGVFAYNGSSIEVADNTVIDSASYAVYVSTSSYAWVHQNTIEGAVRGGILVNRNSDGVVEDNTIVDIGSLGANGRGIFISEDTSAVVRRNTLADCSTAGVQATTRVTADIADNVITNVYSSGGRGIWIGIGSSGSARFNLISNCASDGIGVSSDSVAEVTDNTVSGAGLGVLVGSVGHLRRNTVEASTGVGIRLIASVSGVVEDNVIRAAGGDGIYCTDNFDFSVQGNTIESAGGYGVYLYADGIVAVDGNTIDGCGNHGVLCNLRVTGIFSGNVVRNTGGSGIAVTNQSQLTALNNVIENCVKRGIGVFVDSSGDVRSNVVSNVGFSGIQATGQASAVIVDNVVEGVHVYEGGGHGILVGQGSSGQVTANTVRQTVHSGITVYDTSAAVIVGSNTIREGQALGVSIYAGASPRLEANTIEQNLGNGVKLDDTASAVFEGNSIIDNGGDGVLLNDAATADLGGGGGSAGGNVLTGNVGYAIRNLTSTDVPAFANLWGTVCEEEVEALIWDKLDDPSLGKVLHELFNVHPNVLASGGGTYECGDAIIIGGEISDLNGGLVTYRWSCEGDVIEQGTVQTSSGGTPTPLPPLDVTAMLELGVHEFTLTAWDEVCPAHQSVAGVVVEVVDTTPPEITPPRDIIAEQTSPEGAVVELGDPVVYDVCDPAPVVANDAPVVFPPGLTVVTWTATDASGNSASAAQNVIVQDTTPPAILSAWADPDELWPPDHRMVTVAVYAVLSDVADPAPTYQVTAVASNQPINGLGDGDTSPDWNITGDHTAELRAERSAVLGDRVYSLTIEASDASGNTSTTTVTVVVPHDEWDENSEGS